MQNISAAIIRKLLLSDYMSMGRNDAVTKRQVRLGT